MKQPLAHLDVLYAGDAGTARAAAFVGFLSLHARSVREVDRTAVTPQDLDDVDALIVDGAPLKPDVDVALTLHDVRVPTVLVGGAGGKVADAFGLKVGWEYG